MKIIDAGMAIIGISVKGAWQNNTPYNKGDLVVDADLNSIWRCQVNHTSAETGTFLEDRTAHPSYWFDASQALHARGQWTTATTYYINDVVYEDANKYSWAMATKQYVSSGSYAADVAAGNLVIITDTTTTVTDAQASADAAAASAVSAANSESNAAAFAGTAGNAASTAVNAANNAANSAAAAQTSETNADASEAAAAASASSAATSASTATTQADRAEDEADRAQAISDAMLPDAPSDGNQYGRRNGAWDLIKASATPSDTPPASPTNGQLWWETDSGDLYVFYDDGTSQQWVQVNTTVDAIAVGGGNTALSDYTFSGTTTAPPTSGTVRLNNATQASATEAYVHYTNNNGVDIKNYALANAVPGRELYIQDRDDATKWQAYLITGNAVDNTTYCTIPIVTKASGGNLVSSQRVMIGILGGGGASVKAQDSPPTTPTKGDLWWESDTGKLFIYYDDGTSVQWVQVNDAGGNQGNTFTGDVDIIDTDPSSAIGPNLKLHRQKTSPVSPYAGGELDFYAVNSNNVESLYAYIENYVGPTAGSEWGELYLGIRDGVSTYRDMLYLWGNTVQLPQGKLKFPPTALPSSDANTLDDYEEGSWTPVISFGGAAVGQTYTFRQGRYQKIGNKVTAWCNIQLSAKGTSTGNAAITGFPFAAGSNITWWPAASGSYWAATTTSLVAFGSYLAAGGTSAPLVGAIGAAVSASSLNEGTFSNTTSLMLCWNYEV
jgi:hypothetical protein